MNFDVNKFADGIGQVLGEVGKRQSVDLGRKIRASLDVAVTEINEVTKHAMQQVRTARANLEGYAGELRGIATDLRNELENAKAEGVGKLNEEREKVKGFMADAKVEVVSEANKRLAEMEKTVERVESRLRNITDAASGDLDEFISKRKGEFENAIKGLSVDRIGELIDGYMDEKRLDALADRMVVRFMRAIGRALGRLFARKKAESDGTE